MAICKTKHQQCRQLFLWMMACVYLFAFVSLYSQIPGLYGPEGLLPVQVVLSKMSSEGGMLKRWQSLPSLVVFHQDFGLSPHGCMEFCCVLGAILAFLMMVFRALRFSFMYFLLWLLYLSLYKVGQVFLWFQWDSLLLEAGFLSIIVAPFSSFIWKRCSHQAHDGTTLWLVRWLLFRLMFASGVVKLTSQCPTWWGLTALNYHYESQCIPTPLSWYAHQLPSWLQKMSVVGTFVIEIAVPVFFFAPIRSIRILGFWLQVFLQVLIVLTGNYNFFNILTITLCVSLLDDNTISWKNGDRKSKSTCFSILIFGDYHNLALFVGRVLAFLSIVGYMLALTVYYFDISIELQSWSISSRIMFTPGEFNEVLKVSIPVFVIVAFLSLILEVVNAVIISVSQSGFAQKCSALISTSIFTAAVTGLFAISLVPYAVLDSHFFRSIPHEVKLLHDSLDQFSVTNSYGLFRRMTGVDGRPELIIEGSNDKLEWKEYEFMYKPGNILGVPPYVAPHQPRLDWQMWFAALGNYQQNPWLVHLVYRLLIGQEQVLRLLAASPPFTTPRYIRVLLYTYHFTPYDMQQSVFNQSVAWWQREYRKEYLPPLTWDDPGLQDYLHVQKYLNLTTIIPDDTLLHQGLQWLRKQSEPHTPPVQIWSITICAFILSVATGKLMSPKNY